MHQVGKHRAERVNPQIPLGCQRSSGNVINQFHYSEHFWEDQELERLEEGKEKMCSPFVLVTVSKSKQHWSKGVRAVTSGKGNP